MTNAPHGARWLRGGASMSTPSVFERDCNVAAASNSLQILQISHGISQSTCRRSLARTSHSCASRDFIVTHHSDDVTNIYTRRRQHKLSTTSKLSSATDACADALPVRADDDVSLRVLTASRLYVRGVVATVGLYSST